MTECDALYWKLSQHHDGELDGADCAAIEQHLRECRSCGALRRDLESLARLCREASHPRLPEDVRRRIQDIIEQG